MLGHLEVIVVVEVMAVVMAVVVGRNIVTCSCKLHPKC